MLNLLEQNRPGCILQVNVVEENIKQIIIMLMAQQLVTASFVTCQTVVEQQI